MPHVPEAKSHMLDCLPPTLCPGSSVHRQLGTAYVSATTGAVATALGLKSLTKVNLPHSTAPPAQFTLYLPSFSLPLLHPNLQAPHLSPQSSLPPRGP